MKNIETQENPTAEKIKHTTDVKIVCEAPRHLTRYGGGYNWGTDEYWDYIEKELRRWVKDFHEFIRDHRSQDPVHLDVEREIITACSVCKEEWDTDTDENGEFCANCGARVKSE